jgi:hypothetical protein
MCAARSPRNRTKGFKPKGPLGEALKERGYGACNIWYTSGRKCRGDLILRSDAEFRNVLLLEGDPNVESYVLHSPEAIVRVETDDLRTVFDADVTLRGGERQFQEIKSEDIEPEELTGRERLQFEAQERYAAAHGATYVRVRRRELVERSVFASNWTEGLSYLLAAQYQPLIKQRMELSALLRQQQRCEVGALLKCYDQEEHPLIIAALFSLLAEGDFSSDLASHPWGKRTQVWVAELLSPTLKATAHTTSTELTEHIRTVRRNTVDTVTAISWLTTITLAGQRQLS